MKLSTRIQIVDVDAGTADDICTLGEFFAANEDIGDDWRLEIVDALANWGAYEMGGGASPRVRLEVLS
jgi:hypothetical protein